MHASITSNKWQDNSASPAHPYHPDIDVTTHHILPALRRPPQMNNVTDGLVLVSKQPYKTLQTPWRRMTMSRNCEFEPYAPC